MLGYYWVGKRIVSYLSILAALIFTLGLLSFASLWPGSTAEADHPNGLHLLAMHSSSVHEDFCVLIEDGSMSWSTARTRIRNTLWVDNPSGDWDGLAGNKVWFVDEGVPCDQSPDRASIELEYYVHSSGCGGVSCQWYSYFWDSHGGYQDWIYGYVRFKTSHINGSTFLYHHVINHETGHHLGLADGDGSCPGSIMHSAYYGCSDLEWPSTADRDQVTYEANTYSF